jgi:hypothetical protein
MITLPAGSDLGQFQGDLVHGAEHQTGILIIFLKDSLPPELAVLLRPVEVDEDNKAWTSEYYSDGTSGMQQCVILQSGC